jgi:D-glycero-alpha-D-manno-heptose 1-phosphate guanylyltransferase
MDSKEVIILAGGMGSRIESISNGKPKCLIKIGNKPFLYHLLNQFLTLGADKIILATANKSQYIFDFVNKYFKSELVSQKIVFSNEEIQSGTGGSILFALDKIKSEIFLVSNSDTIISGLTDKIWSSIMLNDMNFLVHLSEMRGQRFSYFKTDETYINDILEENVTSGKTSSGLVFIRKSFFTQLKIRNSFSLENDLLHDEIKNQRVGYKMVGEFIDFGVPEDFARASAEYKKKQDSIFG